MPDPRQLERAAEADNVEGHRQSFASQEYSVSGDTQEAQNCLTAAGRSYMRSGRAYVNAAEEWVRERSYTEEDAEIRRAHAASAYGFAASIYWYAGRSYADAYDFERAGDGMDAAAAAYVHEAELLEKVGKSQQANTLRVEATFRYLDAQRYFQQASEFRRNLAMNLESVGERQAATEERAQADELERRAAVAGAAVNEQGPEYHAGYEGTYQGANRSAYK